ncbi:phosphopentomutase [Oceanisphaera psychrotolerans]|uniref:Phosphopentomutase n=1 Tax=Oceanisphaera psychrotolerans TaxID=1414654 RepID=A0A1J4QIB4_9GAMM|nr:phosphopentomutase [Oceanisphaera psychrotolerans]OIN13487.1 phosphopentomutase [Oceanisphaera psychrotolerans]
MKRAIVLVLDSFGIGASADAARFGDEGADTLGHIAAACNRGEADKGRKGPLSLPHLARLGLFHAHRDSTGQVAEGVTLPTEVTGSYGYAQELSSGKDTPSGHWELAGVPVLFDWGYFLDIDNSFPPSLLDELIERARLPGILGNSHASGTTILEQLGEEHIRSGKPICYTSADSVFQIACHEDHFGLERLYELCELARELLMPYNIGRVIARPFTGECAADFARTGNRRDYSIAPPAPTVLQKLVEEKNGEVVSIGKIADIYAHFGITRKVKATGMDALFDATLNELERAGDRTLIMTNFVDFDSSFGHRRNIAGYAAELEAFDRRLPELLARLQPDDLLIMTADHGCDPTWVGTEHTREHIPVICLGGGLEPGSLGGRDTFADVGQSLARYFGTSPMDYGSSFLQD